MNHANTQAFVAEALAVPADRWRTPTVPGKWSPAQVTEHVVLAYEAGARIVSGEEPVSEGPPKFLRPIIRTAIRLTTLRTGKFPKSKTQPIFAPKDVAATQSELCARLERASISFEQVSGAAVSGGQKQFEHPFFGSFGVVEYMRFVAFHTAHHQKQLSWSG
jgi:hypothetical protein